MLFLGNIYLNLYRFIEEHQRSKHKCFSAARNRTLNKMSLEMISEFDHHHQLHKSIYYGKPYFAILLAGFPSLAGWFLGYDQGVTGGVVVMSSFKNDFYVRVYANASVCDLPVTALPPGYRRFLVLFTLLYNVGCFLGALFISSFVAENLDVEQLFSHLQSYF
jgi:hypothetical protein